MSDFTVGGGGGEMTPKNQALGGCLKWIQNLDIIYVSSLRPNINAWNRRSTRIEIIDILKVFVPL